MTKPLSVPTITWGASSVGKVLGAVATPRPTEVRTESTSGTATLPTKLPALNREPEYRNVSTRKMDVPAPVAPQAANEWVEGMP